MQSLAQALVNAEVTETSNNTLLQELQEARAAVTRLSAHHARSLGWETRLKNTLHERDDLQQERDSLLSQARVADQRMNVLKDKCCASFVHADDLR
jgi:DNA repair exonuclease SbcCD ATPase subunit